MKYLNRRYLSPDALTGAAAPPATAPNGQPPATTGDATGDGDTPVTTADKTFTQADVDRIIKERLEREQEKARKAEEKARKEAELAGLAQQQEWQTLAAKRQEALQEMEERLKPFEDMQEKLGKYEKALNAFLQGQLAGVPDHVVDLLKGRDPVEQLDWLTANRDKFAQQPQTPLGTTPAPTQPGRMTDEQRRKLAFKPRL